MKTYRTNGAIGALLDEYEKAIVELQTLIEPIKTLDLCKIVDHETTDLDCISIQSILTHVVSAGHVYVTEIRKSFGEHVDYPNKELLDTVDEYKIALDLMFNAMVTLFDDYPKIQLEVYDVDKKIQVRWGQSYDVDQLFEHAIVHILRHRRQLERFILKLVE